MVHIGETTLLKRVNEFSTTEAGGLTVDEFETHTQAADAALVSPACCWTSSINALLAVRVPPLVGLAAVKQLAWQGTPLHYSDGALVKLVDQVPRLPGGLPVSHACSV